MEKIIKKNICIRLFIHEKLVDRKRGNMTLNDVIEQALQESEAWRKEHDVR
jgi:predicted CopG family antitoxin